MALAAGLTAVAAVTVMSAPAAAVAAAAGPGLANTGFATDIAIDGVGTSPAPVLSFSFGATQSGTFAFGGGGGAGKVSMQDIHFTKYVDQNSPKLFLATATGQHLKKATITCRKKGSTEAFLVITLEDVLVSSYQTGGSGDAVPTEQISLNFAKIKYEVNGAAAGWDVAANKGT